MTQAPPDPKLKTNTMTIYEAIENHERALNDFSKLIVKGAKVTKLQSDVIAGLKNRIWTLEVAFITYALVKFVIWVSG